MHTREEHGVRQFANKFIAVVAASLLGLSMMVSLGGCETTKGVGQDIESAGEGMDDTF